MSELGWKRERELISSGYSKLNRKLSQSHTSTTLSLASHNISYFTISFTFLRNKSCQTSGDTSASASTLTMHFSLSVLSAVGSLTLICCSSLAVGENNLVPRRPHWQHLPDKHSTYSSSRQPIRKSECTRENISLRKEWLVSMNLQNLNRI